MDAKSSEPLKYQTWFLKVSIHCEGCRRKVKKILRSIDGVFTTTIDPQQQKVTVTGSVGVETLIRKLARAGKHAEIWPENISGKGKPMKKKNEKRDQESIENHSADNAESNRNKKEIESAHKCNNKNKNSDSKTGGKPPEKSPAGNQSPEKDHKGGQSEGGSGKKKKKGQNVCNGNNGLSAAPSNNAPAHTGSQFQMNLSPTRQQSYPYADSIYYPPLVYFSTYNNLYPMVTMDGPSYYVPSLPYMGAGLDYDPYYQVQSAPLVSFEIFSDENANWCSIM
ncbi:hypothetical protein TanjilG_18402 [Lupinus angustifolius]|uniref:HMA domain-containing protein n=1 Tax=Lupinus angustifolius TaxID=3871 RepID=A0A4P1RWK6_LUPAN|nr:PREDICTED: heavy metal-associated isoprenylated plant protein 35-like [Lupinus angustifolius]OIW19592.1 hypothetical protein TanjilG_18402 [Lupinus angustifolius]